MPTPSCQSDTRSVESSSGFRKLVSLCLLRLTSTLFQPLLRRLLLLMPPMRVPNKTREKSADAHAVHRREGFREEQEGHTERERFPGRRCEVCYNRSKLVDNRDYSIPKSLDTQSERPN